MTDTNTNKRLEGPPHSGGPDLVRDSDGFLRSPLPASARQSIAFRKAYVLELIAMEADPNFSLRDGYLRTVAERVSQRFFLGPKHGVRTYSTPPSPGTLRRWYRTYLEAGCDPQALLPARPRPNREPAPYIDPGPPLHGDARLVRDDDGFMRLQSRASSAASNAFRKACVLEILKLEADPAFVLRAWHVPLIVERALQRLGLGACCRPLSLATLRRWRRADAYAELIARLRKLGSSALDGASSPDRHIAKTVRDVPALIAGPPRTGRPA